MGMIESFQTIANSGGSQPRSDEVAKGISTALFITLEGVTLAVPAIFFYAMFRNRIALIALEATKVADRTIGAFYTGRQGPGRREARHPGLIDRSSVGRRSASADRAPTPLREMHPCPRNVTGEIKAEPNLTPLLDVVFQLITFFMLVINFSADTYDQRVRLPVAATASMPEAGKSLDEDRLVFNINKDGKLLWQGEELDTERAIKEIQRPGAARQVDGRPHPQEVRRRQGRRRQPAHHDRHPLRPRHHLSPTTIASSRLARRTGSASSPSRR